MQMEGAGIGEDNNKIGERFLDRRPHRQQVKRMTDVGDSEYRCVCRSGIKYCTYIISQ